ncbi:MAG: ABC transporter permease [Gemmatimonadetes bacterium]|nr:ABC transporter permease [Gemmatimonadota bacterium]
MTRSTEPHDRRARRLLGAYRRLGALLPASARRQMLEAAALDASELVRRASHRGGRGAAAAAALRAMADLAVRIGAERARERRTRAGGERMRAWTTAVRQAVRGLLRRPAYATVAALTLSLGIGANVAIFAVVDGVLLQPLEYPDPDAIVLLEHHAPGLDLPTLPQSDGTALMYAREVSSFSAFTSLETQGRNLAGEPGMDARRITVLATNDGFFPVFGVRPALGRALVAADSEVGAPPVGLLADELWTSDFGRDPAVVGRTLLLDGEAVEIVGVLPAGVRVPDEDFQAIVALELDPDEGFGSFSHSGLGRLAPGVDLSAAQAEIDALQTRIPEFFPDVQEALLEAAGWSASLTPLKDEVVSEIRATLWILMGTVALVFVIAAANVANLVLVRAESRQRETAVRTALGAGRVDLLRTFVAESGVLAVTGGVLGLVFASVTLRSLLQLAPAGLPRREAVGLTPPVLVFAVALVLGATIVFGLVPFVRVRLRAVAGTLKDGMRGSTGSRGALRARNGLVVVQLALALVLVAGSGLMLRSFQALRSVDPGIDAEGVTSVRVSLDRSYAEPGASSRFYRELQERLEGLPGVEAVGAVSQVPLEGRGYSAGSFEIEGWDRPADAPPVVAWRQRVTPGYFEALDIPLVRGRGPTWADTQERAPVVWITETLAERFVTGDPVGSRLRDGDEGPWMEIVGVVGDVRIDGVENELRPGILRTAETVDIGDPSLQMAVLVEGPPADLVVPAVRSALRELDPGVPISVAETVEEMLARDLADTSFTALLLGLAAVLSLALGTVGIYGVISYVVAQRTRELGVRMALGAAAGDVRSMVVKQGLGVTLLGLAVGLVGAVGLTRVLRTLLYEVSATDPWVLGGTTLLLLVVSMLASFIPALRASRVDPVEALRSE